MTRAQRSNMIAHAVQVILERPNLSSGIVHVLIAPLLTMWYIAGKIQPLHGENDMVLRLVVEYTILGGESLELNDDYRWQSGDSKGLCGTARYLASRAIPFIVSIHDLAGNKVVDEFLDHDLVFASGDREGDVHECIVCCRCLSISIDSCRRARISAYLATSQALETITVLSLK